VQLPIVDVRDVAAAHVFAMTHPDLRGFNGRYLMATQSLWFSEMVDALRARRSELGLGRLKTRKIGRFFIHFAALAINPSLRQILPFVNQPLELVSAPELVQAMSGHDYVPID